MTNNPYDKFQKNRILSAPASELPLMLYDGMIKFANIAQVAMRNKDIEKAHINIIKIENILNELSGTLNKDYEVAKDFELIYTNIFNLLLKANISKDPDDLEPVLKELREIRDIWKKVMEMSK